MKRYRVDIEGFHDSPDGEFVQHEDAQAEVERLRAELARVTHNALLDEAALSEHTSELVHVRAQLAAANALLERANAPTIEWCAERRAHLAGQTAAPSDVCPGCGVTRARRYDAGSCPGGCFGDAERYAKLSSAPRRWECVNKGYRAVVYDGLFENEAQLIAAQHGLVALESK
jgi:hypothetical protein